MPDEKPESNGSNSSVKKIGQLLNNPISLIGIALAVVALGNIAFLFFIDLTSEHPSPYLGILAYMVAPAFFIAGLALALFGIWYYRRKAGRGEAPKGRLRLDFNDPAQRGAFAFFMSFIVVFVLMSVVGSYKAYEFTDSVQFCGQLCHEVMNPEFTAYQLSPHARVACVDCHVGSGATWYVKSKLSGARQVFAAGPRSFTELNSRYLPTTAVTKKIRPGKSGC